MPWSYGSQYQLRRWILERPDDLNHNLCSGNDELGRWARRIEWLSPTTESATELRNQAWRAIGLPEPSPQAAGWWPPGGPVWDAVARVTGEGGEIGGVFVEAKGRINELRSGGSKATAESSVAMIHSGFLDVQAALGVLPMHDWRRAYYQPASRLAVLWFARYKHDPPAPVWLVSVYFLGEHCPTVTVTRIGPTSEAAWEPAINDLHDEMGLPAPPHALSPWWIESFLPALQPPDGWPRSSGDAYP
jgi:hypothetical protein